MPDAADTQPKHYVPLTGIGGIAGDSNTTASPPEWNWKGAHWKNTSGHFSRPDGADIGLAVGIRASKPASRRPVFDPRDERIDRSISQDRSPVGKAP
jgi:hypothetical protein